MEKKKPEIRFNGYTDKWEVKELREVLITHPYKKHIGIIANPARYPIIQQGNNPIMGLGSGLPYLDFKDKIIWGDHTTSVYRPTEPFLVATDGIRILSIRNMNQMFLWNLILYIKPIPKSYTRHFSMLVEKAISIPSIEEQDKIGLFLTTLDKLITKLEAKLDKLRKLKQALLEKMFANVNRGRYETPEIRFKGYIDKWQVKELREVFEMPTNRISGSELQADRYISTEHILQNFEGVEPTTSMPANLSAIRFFQNDILMANIRPYLKKIWLSDRNGGASSDVIVFHITIKSDPAFLYYELTNGQFIEYVMESIQGSKMPRGNKQAMQAFKMAIAPLSEQEQIGKCFTQIDTHFSKTSTKLTKLRNIKQSLLQKMFA